MVTLPGSRGLVFTIPPHSTSPAQMDRTQIEAGQLSKCYSEYSSMLLLLAEWKRGMHNYLLPEEIEEIYQILQGPSLVK